MLRLCLVCFCTTALGLGLGGPSIATGQENVDDGSTAPATRPLELADGKLKMQALAAWKTVEPKFNMIEAEFSVAKQGDDENDGRITIMAAGGSVEANIQRWESQFSQPDGSSVNELTTVDKVEISGMPAHLVDISGTYADRAGGPSSPPVMRDNYRMLAAIVDAGDSGMYFIKFYGGADTVKANAKAFDKFVESLTAG